MSEISQHSEWLSLIQVTGPFLAEPVLKYAFPQGLEGLDGAKKKLVRQAYDEWREAIDLDDPAALKIHQAWIELVLRQGLELDEDGLGDVLKHADDLLEVKRELPEHGLTLAPDFAVIDGQSALPLMLIAAYEPQIVLGEAFKQGTWSASPGERMVELCHATGVRLGLVTNGEQWMLVDAPVGAVTTFASWYGRLWAQEPITLQAFVSLLGIRRFFVDRREQLPALLDDSLKYQDEVTDALGEQVRRAVEVLIQALDRVHVDSNRTLLEGVEPAELYEAGLTVMMRIVFLLSAEERGLLLLGDELYEANYAVSTLRIQLRAESEEILERRWDAWSRLLSLFRAVYGGINHEALRLPALGGSLFDPDRFPFMEGRPRGSRWAVDMARPLPIDNRTVMLLLEAVQLFRGRTLSYMALDVEQIGHVYEGLLERTAVRATEVTLDLKAAKGATNPWAMLPEVEDAADAGHEALERLFKRRTESSASRIRNDLNEPVDDVAAEKLLTACDGDGALANRVRPYFHLMRTDPWGYPLVYPVGSFMVASGSDRRESGTHYTPKSFTEAIVRDTLEPVIYIGASQGYPREEWQLKSPAELLDLKVCDPAMGSGAFLVQVCRYLADRLNEAWSRAEMNGQYVTSAGAVVEELGRGEPLRTEDVERVILARRLVAERCLYGVDLNPLAVELAKLSIWLVTLAKGRPFGFLDHNLRSGDSLLGVTSLEQLHFLELNPDERSAKKLFAADIDRFVERALNLRLTIRGQPIRDIKDIEAIALIDQEARTQLLIPELIADAIVSDRLASHGKSSGSTSLSIDVGAALNGSRRDVDTLAERAARGLKEKKRPHHWPVEFPEVFLRAQPGFDAVIGNPPFLGCKYISGILGDDYFQYLSSISEGPVGRADLVVHFLLRGYSIARPSGVCGFIATKSISQGDTKAAGLSVIYKKGATIFKADKMIPWPGSASVIVSVIHFCTGPCEIPRILNGHSVEEIDDSLSPSVGMGSTFPLPSKSKLSFIGYMPLGDGFIISEQEAQHLISLDIRNTEVVKRYLTGKNFNTSPTRMGSEWIIDFADMSYEQAETYERPFAIVRERVKPYRDKVNRKANRERWWQFAEVRPGLRRAIGGLSEVLVVPIVTKNINFGFASSEIIFSNKFCILPISQWSIFAVYQSSVHLEWVLQNHTTLGSTLNYTPKFCFETFPDPAQLFSEGDRQHPKLADIGKRYSAERDEIALEKGIGLTSFYNMLHNRNCSDAQIVRFRGLHEEMDDAVLSAYDWDDIPACHEFCEIESGAFFTLSEHSRREVLRRTVTLNRTTYAAEAATLKSAPQDIIALKQIRKINTQTNLFDCDADTHFGSKK